MNWVWVSANEVLGIRSTASPESAQIRFDSPENCARDRWLPGFDSIARLPR